MGIGKLKGFQPSGRSRQNRNAMATTIATSMGAMGTKRSIDRRCTGRVIARIAMRIPTNVSIPRVSQLVLLSILPRKVGVLPVTARCATRPEKRMPWTRFPPHGRKAYQS